MSEYHVNVYDARACLESWIGVPEHNEARAKEFRILAEEARACGSIAARIYSDHTVENYERMEKECLAKAIYARERIAFWTQKLRDIESVGDR